MKRINTLLFIENLAKFKIIKDEKDTEFIVFENSPLDSVTGITDRTAFEAVENHVHILDDITPREFKKLLPVAESLGNMLLCCLKQCFPDRKFFVFVSIHVGDSFIIRFHQKWEKETPYYYPEDFNGPKKRMFGFEG